MNFGDIISNAFTQAFASIKDWLVDFLNYIQSIIMLLLPDSPFKGLTVPSYIQEILGYVNWIVPFYMIGNTLLAWIVAIGVYYAYQTILRWVKTIQ